MAFFLILIFNELSFQVWSGNILSKYIKNIYIFFKLLSHMTLLYLIFYYYCFSLVKQFFYFPEMRFIFQINISWLLFHNFWLICFCPSICVAIYEITPDRGKRIINLYKAHLIQMFPNINDSNKKYVHSGFSPVVYKTFYQILCKLFCYKLNLHGYIIPWKLLPSLWSEFAYMSVIDKVFNYYVTLIEIYFTQQTHIFL